MIATPFLIKSPDGELTRTIVRVSSPRRARSGEWTCHVEIVGVLPRTRVHGVDALQALGLALNCLGTMMYGAQKAGNRFLFPTGEQVSLGWYFRVREFQRRLSARGRRARAKSAIRRRRNASK